MKPIRNFEDLRIEEILCEKLDANLYVPIKEEIKKDGKTHTLGFKKEGFKRSIAGSMNQLRAAAIHIVQNIITTNKIPVRMMPAFMELDKTKRRFTLKVEYGHRHFLPSEYRKFEKQLKYVELLMWFFSIEKGELY